MKPLRLALPLLLLASPATVQGQDLQAGAQVRVAGIETGSSLNVRAGPGTFHGVVGKLSPARDGLSLLECQGSWCRVEIGQGVAGWVSSGYLEAVAPPPRPAWHEKFSPEISYRVTGIGAGSALNMRAGPGTTHPVVGRLPSGRAGLTILDCTEAADWCEVNAGGRLQGWVATRYLGGVVDALDASGRPVEEQRVREATRLATVTGIVVKPGETATIPELPPWLLGSWDRDAAACKRADSPTRVAVQPNGLRVGASNARFKNAVFRDGGYDLTALLMDRQALPTPVPQRALYRLEPRSATLVLSGDVLAERNLTRCE